VIDERSAHDCIKFVGTKHQIMAGMLSQLLPLFHLMKTLCWQISTLNTQKRVPFPTLQNAGQKTTLLHRVPLPCIFYETPDIKGYFWDCSEIIKLVLLKLIIL
jgi:hypothetical protein